MAFLISIGLNVILVAVDFSIDPRRAELLRIQRWDVRLLSPAKAMTMGFAPITEERRFWFLSFSLSLSMPSQLGRSLAYQRGGGAGLSRLQADWPLETWSVGVISHFTR
jgi:hypothetical protein